MKRLMAGLLLGLLFLAMGRRLSTAANEHLDQAQKATRSGDYSASAAAYRRAEAAGATTPQVANNLGASLYRTQHFAEAHATYARAVAAGAARAAYNQGNCLFQQACTSAESPQGDLLRRAIASYQESLKLSSDQGLQEQARYNLELAKQRLYKAQSPSENTVTQRGPEKPAEECPH